MGLLLEEDGPGWATLGRRFLVGRARHCQLRLDNGRVSGEHASIRWSADGWHLRDLGSRNGTRVDDAVVPSGGEVPLREGCTVSFGSNSVSWRLASDAAPCVRASAEGSGMVIDATQGLLALPSSDNPEYVLLLDEGGAWTAERDGETLAVKDGDVVELSRDTWRLQIPARNEVVPTTRATEDAPRLITSVALSMRVSSDREFISASLTDAHWTGDLGARAFNEILLLLARARLDDAQRDVSPADQGWIYAEELCRMAGLDRPLLDLHVHRARQRAGATGIENPGQLIERRASTRQLRLGLHRISIVES